MATQQSFSEPNLFGHVYGQNVQEGYAVCSACDCVENTNKATQPCQGTMLGCKLLHSNKEIDKLVQWIHDCGHRYGPQDEVPSTMADILKRHIEQCSKHPMSKLKFRVNELIDRVKRFNRLVSKIAMGEDMENAYIAVEDALDNFGD